MTKMGKKHLRWCSTVLYCKSVTWFSMCLVNSCVIWILVFIYLCNIEYVIFETVKLKYENVRCHLHFSWWYSISTEKYLWNIYSMYILTREVDVILPIHIIPYYFDKHTLPRCSSDALIFRYSFWVICHGNSIQFDIFLFSFLQPIK